MVACPICGSAIIVTKQQVRADDEAATLVSVCPVHGTIGNVALKYMCGFNRDKLVCRPDIVVTHDNTVELWTINESGYQELVNGRPIYLYTVRVYHPSTLPQCEGSFMSVISTVTIRCTRYQCHRHFNHPLYNTSLGLPDGIVTMVIARSVIGPVTVQTMSMHEGMYDSSLIMNRPINCMYDIISDNNGIVMMYYTVSGSGYYAVDTIGTDEIKINNHCNNSSPVYQMMIH